jgi:hypothetical protein
MRYLFVFLLVLSLIVTSCFKPDEVIEKDFELKFSVDTLLFDTLLAQFQSPVKRLMVYNRGTKAVRINRVILSNGSGSAFQVNLDGERGSSFENHEISAKDSLFVFVSVKLPSSATGSYMYAEDSLVFDTGSERFKVVLSAYGLATTRISSGELMDLDWEPHTNYHVLGKAVVAQGQVLNIGEGCKVFFSADAGLGVSGSIVANGTLEAPVVFSGERMDLLLKDLSYNEIPGQWQGISLKQGSKANLFNYCLIRNAKVGLDLEPNSEVLLENSMITNHTIACINSVNAVIDAQNCVFSNARKLIGITGGSHEFIHCTLANFYWWQTRYFPSVTIANFSNVEGSDLFYPLTRCNWLNCIVEGGNSSEILFEKKESVDFNYFFDHCLLRLDTFRLDKAITASIRNANFFNKNAQFVNRDSLNFRLDAKSDAIDKAKTEHALRVPFDKSCVDRLTGLPDIGAFERVKKSGE